MVRLKHKIDRERVRAAIERAEQRSSGEIVVSVADYFLGNVHGGAQRAFERMGIANTRQRNGVLLFICPARRQFEIIGDVAIHARVRPSFWSDVAAALSRRFHDGDFTAGLVEAIELVGTELATHFPPQPGDVNELPDEPHVPDHHQR